MNQTLSSEDRKFQPRLRAVMEVNEFLPFDVPICNICVGQWSREGDGRTIRLGGLRYYVCGDCVEQQKLSAFIAARGGRKNRFSRPLRYDDVISLVLALLEKKGPGSEPEPFSI